VPQINIGSASTGLCAEPRKVPKIMWHLVSFMRFACCPKTLTSFSPALKLIMKQFYIRKLSFPAVIYLCLIW